MPYRVKGNAGKRQATPKDIARNTFQNTEDLFNAELVDWAFEDLSIPQSKIIGGSGGLMPLVEPSNGDFLVKQSPAGDGTLVDAGFPIEGRRSDTLEWVEETKGPTPGTSLNGAYGVAIGGNYAYITCATRNSLAVVNIADPTNPTWVAETLGPIPGTSLQGARKVAISGSYAYLACTSRNSLAVIDISNPLAPTFVAETQGPVPGTSLQGAESIAISGSCAYLACKSRGSLAVIDISNPLVPTFLAETQGPVPGVSLDFPVSVCISGNYAYIASFFSDNLAVIDVGGLWIQSIEAGSIRTDRLDVLRHLTVAGRISTPSGIGAGSLNADRGVGGAYVREHRVVDTVGAAYDLDSLLAGLWVLTLEGTHAVDVLNLLPGRTITIQLIQGTTGNHIPTLTGVTWDTTGIPVWSTVAGDYDVIEITSYDGVNLTGRLLAQYQV